MDKDFHDKVLTMALLDRITGSSANLLIYPIRKGGIEAGTKKL